MIRLLRTLRNLWSNRHINRGFKQLEAGSGILLLTPEMAWAAACFDAWRALVGARLAARRLFRPDRQKAARRGVETRRRAA